MCELSYLEVFLRELKYWILKLNDLVVYLVNQVKIAKSKQREKVTIVKTVKQWKWRDISNSKMYLWANKTFHSITACISCRLWAMAGFCHPGRHDSVADERRELRQMIRTLWRMILIITKWLVPCLVVSYHTSECLTGGGGGLYPGRVLHGFHFLYRGYRHPTLSLSTSWAPLGSHMVSRDDRGYTPRGSGGKVSTIVNLLGGYLCPKELTCNKQWKEELELLLLTNG